MTFGGAHTGLYHYLKGDNLKVQIGFIEKPYVYGYSTEISRRVLFGKEVPDALVCRAALSTVIENLLKMSKINLRKTPSTVLKKFSRECVGSFTDEEVINFLSEFRQLNMTEKTAYVLKRLAAKQVVMPTNIKQLSEFVNK